ncbi:LacI family DNA-binding transcriptional regulator [Oceanobacillus manasiensis]|uniref:LacI family DNA-binding transcriptional regulator n=1 Tax=Oceanobacillus manasiensis TaxID=586413 RepID=UPI0005A61571|nr:LacI family DNA-binding transcriptional regulator [Oceanobacillus manasiensis]
MVKIHDVAKLAGVSVATVSRVVNNNERVAENTRVKVEWAIRELNYAPSVLGRNLRTSKSNLLLVLLPSISNPFYTEIINGIEDTAIARGYNILLCETDSNPKREAIYFNLLRNRLAEGIISMDPSVNKNKLNELSESYPIVQCSEYDTESPIPYVTIDSEQAAYDAVTHLIESGHQKIALINSDERFLYARQRRNGYEKAMEAHGLPIKGEWIYHAEQLDFKLGQNAIRKLLQLDDQPTAVFAVSDVYAIGALKEIHRHGKKVPEDIAIIGFDKIIFSDMAFPTLSTIAQPMYEMGCISAEMIMDKINGIAVKSRVLDHQLICRDST